MLEDTKRTLPGRVARKGAHYAMDRPHCKCEHNCIWYLYSFTVGLSIS